MEAAFDNPAYEASPSNSPKVAKNLIVEPSNGIHEAPTQVQDAVVTRNGDADVMGIRKDVSSPVKLQPTHSCVALSVRNGYKSYQRGVPVLNDFNMTVPVGTIYSLLGSSGCGKTTMLSCCVGIKNLDKGDISLFGHRPGSKESGVPGSRVGYMPQELSLYNELTIQEALNFYGRIYGMRKDEMVGSTAFLVDFLDLPKATRRVGSLSGGQKRRVSIAIALLHNPELLILDEPTVGVDPLLRESIWGHLVKLVRNGSTTVIITTHYVEEARQSDFIGIMRNGRLLAEKSPEALISEFNVNLLEEIVLTLCRMDREEKKRRAGEQAEHDKKFVETSLTSYVKRKLSNAMTDNVVGIRYENTSKKEVSPTKPGGDSAKSREGIGTVKTDLVSALTSLKEYGNKDIMKNGLFAGIQLPHSVSIQETMSFQQSTPVRRLTALLIKNFIILMRNIGFLLFIFLVPAIQVILICLTIGADPKGLLLGVVNPEGCDFEGKDWRNISNTCPISIIQDINKTVKEDSLSCFYLAMLPEESFILERQESEHKAIQKIQGGYTYGYIQFPHEYTENVKCRFGGHLIGCKKTIDEIYAGSNIILELDMSNKQIGQTMKRIFVDAYSASMDRIKLNCQSRSNPEDMDLIGEIPYTFKKPVYGKDDTSFREFLAPSILLGLLFFFPLCSSGVSYITEKKTGTLDRALVAGVGTTELMGGFLISQVGILLGQAGFAFLILTQVFQIEILGSVSLALFLTILVGISGMSAGFLIAMVCEEEVQAVLLAIGTFFPNILLAGMVWPLEGMERGLQYISYLLPCTLACESMRSIISRGWTLLHRTVWPGFLSTFAWIVVYWILAVAIHRIKSKG